MLVVVVVVVVPTDGSAVQRDRRDALVDGWVGVGANGGEAPCIRHPHDRAPVRTLELDLMEALCRC